MRCAFIVFLVLGDLVSSYNAAATDTNSLPVPIVAITNLLTHREEFKGKRVEVTGYYIADFECSKLSSHPGAASKQSLWIWAYHIKPEPGAKITLVEKGKVRVIGVFDYNKLGSGHLNMYGGEIGRVELFEPLK